MYTGEKILSINNSYSPSDETSIARYMDFPKFIDLMENSELYFSNSKNFEDKFEGEIPESYFSGWAETSREEYLKIKEAIKSVQNVYVNCWSRFESESYALWKIYTNPRNGICIKTTVGKLKNSLNNNIEVMSVKYIDSYYDKNNRIDPAFYFKEIDGKSINTPLMETLKFKPYEYEDEIRCIYVDDSRDNYKRFKIEDLNNLIEEIYVSPFASKWIYELITKLVYGRYGLNHEIKIKKSKIKI